MFVAVLDDFNKLDLCEEPTPKDNDAPVKIISCEFCAMDYRAIKGIRRNVASLLISEHEPSGIVAAAGCNVAAFRDGDEVICQSSGYCGIGRFCRAGNTRYCEHAGTTGWSGADDPRPDAVAEDMVAGECRLFHKPFSISFDPAALAE